ncbi:MULTISPECIES: AraC family transcriptional regulator [Micrococcaceae]|jgi:AraC-like DNA-binding protein/mannose-6-phosphate isomerase-like protein (cupin superfamily)|uniref:AraC family transcriptional regulator n=1 Tax=Micrococcaceae TaxID=1268 RepID=UPI002AA66AFF|nr:MULTISPECIES: AraC family transcriptional regulator [Pseudarthrobacter]MEA3549328.1 AraC family transcriptional regulator [Pseudarthrobacter sp. C1]WPU10310.1 AraC family transcriptional regulator [Pseudarthrobacter oxydans]HET7782896.1 AraC family transcriptional regulator [Arthrobacter sp.]
MTATDTADGAAARLAERLLGMRANREIIPPDPNHSVRWVEHSYPSPVARWNYHPEYEIHLIRKGTGKFIVGDHIGTFEAGHVSLVGSGLPHDWVSDLEPGEVLENRDAVIQFDGKWVEQTASLVPEMAEVKPLLEQSRRGIEFLGPSAENAAAAIEAMGASTGLVRLRHLLDLFVVLARAPQEERRYLADEWFRPQLDGQAAAVVDIVLEYVFTNHAGSVKMSEAAGLVGMSEPTFSKYFKRATGQNFSDLVRKLRLAHARRLLEHSDKAISEICYEVGFSNLSNFNRHFLNDAGETPRNYRQRVQG